MLFRSVSSQTITITGTVTDQNEPLPGVNVVIKGTTTGVISDIDGKFSINVPNKETVLQFSFMGYISQEISVGDQTFINVSLEEDTREIEEVVVVGFGTQKKVNLTGSVGTVNSKDLQNRPIANVSQALQGLSPGLNIRSTTGMLDATPSIDIRGVGNLGTGSGSAPLVLVDGVESDLNVVNPQDIENISVLKDAAASSIYGSRAPFGVILITTKRGKAGQIKASYSNNFSWQSPTIWPRTMNALEMATFDNDASDNSNAARYFSDARIQRIKDFMSGASDIVIYPNPANPTSWISAYSEGSANNDIYKMLFKKYAFVDEHNVNVNGGSDRITFYAGLRFLGQDGLLKIGEDKFRTIAPTATIEAKITDWMNIRYTTRFSRTDYNKPTELTDNLFNDVARQGWPAVPLKDQNGHWNQASRIPYLENGGETDRQVDNFINHASIILEPIKNWVTTAEFNYNIKSYSQRAVEYTSYFYNVLEEPIMNRQSSYVSNSFYKDNFLTFNLYSSYRFTLDNRHNFAVMAGAQMEELKRNTYGLSRVGVLVNELPVVDLTSGLDYLGSPVSPSVYGATNEWSTAGFFGRLNYDYQERYLLEANFRYDGTSRFREETRWNWYSSFSVGWNIANERFWDNLRHVVNLLKLRGSYGELGNQNTSSWFPTYQVMSVSASAGSWLQGGLKPNVAYSPELISSSLTWERINSLNVGIDAAAFNNRLSASVDIFQRKTLDMVGPAMELPNILGKAVPRSNNTDLKTTGFELEIGWRDLLKSGLSYSVKFLLSDYQTEITRYPNFTKSLSTYYEGQKLGSIWGYETIGIAKSNEEMQAHLASLPNGGQNALGSQWLAGDIMYKDLNGDGKIDAGSTTYSDPGDRKIIGNNTPRYQFGLDLNAAWKGFDIRAFFQGVGKRNYVPTAPSFWGLTSTGYWGQVVLKDHLDYFREQPSNDLPANINSYYPRPLMSGAAKNQAAQTRYLQNAAYIRLKNLSLGYTLPQNITRNLYISSLRFYISGENLWLGTKMAKMYDPEIISNLSTEGSIYPLQKSFSFGLTIIL